MMSLEEKRNNMKKKEIARKIGDAMSKYDNMIKHYPEMKGAPRSAILHGAKKVAQMSDSSNKKRIKRIGTN